MVYFCADDYGICQQSNSHIEKCLTDGALNKVSVLPNGTYQDFKQRLSVGQTKLSLHINLVEGAPLSDPSELDLIVSEDGYFKHSFIGLGLLSFSRKRKKLQEQLYKEIQAQIIFWKKHIGDNTPVCLDSHQHVHMIPLIFKTLLKVIKDENLQVAALRFPDEPLMPYLKNPSLYLSYELKGIMKQWVIKILAIFDRGPLKKTKIPTTCFMGLMFSGKMTQQKIHKLLPHYLKIAKKQGKDIEIAFHPGYVEDGEKLLEGNRAGFEQYYFSPWRKVEFETLMNLKFEQ